jgi:hypothetical protein
LLPNNVASDVTKREGATFNALTHTATLLRMYEKGGRGLLVHVPEAQPRTLGHRRFGSQKPDSTRLFLRLSFLRRALLTHYAASAR